ncbi:DEAD/DEAH box helicase [Weissella viridescens]|uniref:DEAD/DEAH box helicase n=1 Tax=Weissella viridescens TaxID=1629 RepID=UPI0022E432C9|nr:DEAD/DEAH box helicase [Weissella viridescens]
MSKKGSKILTMIGNNPEFSENFFELMYLKENIDLKEAEYLYAIAITLINEYNNNPEMSMYVEFAYSIIARTSFKINEFNALFDFSVNYGYYPIAREISRKKFQDKQTISQFISDAKMDEYQIEGRMLTFDQRKVMNSVLEDSNNRISFLAPTSYGKTSLIFQHIKKSGAQVVAIVVPTKALIDQVTRDAKKEIKDRKIISHDQQQKNIESKEPLIAVVTQERALRLLDEGVVFDTVYIDEAQELLEFNFSDWQRNRSLLLSRFIKINRLLNPDVTEVYLSPVLNSSQDLVLDDGNISEHKIERDLKILDIQLLNSQLKVCGYDIYLNEMFSIGEVENINQFIILNSRKKNLHYLYRPKDVEAYAGELYSNLDEQCEGDNVPQEIQELIDELKNLYHPDFQIAKYLGRGIVYVHGKLPNNLRNYLLDFFRNSEYITHFVANSVVLEGMNLPIDNLFYVSGNAKTQELFNLFGRVNRLNEIFSEKHGDLEKIFVPIRFIESEKYPQFRDGGMEKKIRNLRKGIENKIKNPTLDNFKADEKNEERTIEINYLENEMINSFQEPDFLSKLTKGGAQQLLNYNKKGLNKLEARIKDFKSLEDTTILEIVRYVFFNDFDADDFNPEYNAKRLEKEETVVYYNRFVKAIHEKPLSAIISHMVKYWQSGKANNFVYVGSSFGENVFESTNYDGTNKIYVKLSNHIKDTEFLVNLAFIKIQLDEEFLSYEINLLVNTLLEFEIVSEDEVNEFFYGTNDDKVIELINSGLSNQLIMFISDNNQLESIFFDSVGNIQTKPEFKEFINQQKGLIRFELKNFFE